MVDDLPGIVLGGEEVVGCNIMSDSAPLQEHENVLVRLRRISESLNADLHVPALTGGYIILFFYGHIFLI
jgi:hypothetical protein